ncbi:MAG: hypothetical protein JKY08_04230 [Flavobacteriaceae bacterium]|nr:hypothetical protein [Flavobacteriaceae bacterium]
MNKKIILYAVLLLLSIGLLWVDLMVLENLDKGYYIRKITLACLIVSNVLQLKKERDRVKSIS